jgi:hypothetical protein
MPDDCGNSWLWKRLLPTNTSWWELAAAAITLVFAFRHAAISLFYARFNVSPEEVGVGVTTVALQSAVLMVGLYIAANALSMYFSARSVGMPWRRLKERVKRLRSSKNGTWLVIGFFLHRAIVYFSLIAFFRLLQTVDGRRTISLGGLNLPLRLVVVGIFVVVWIGLGRLNRPFRESAIDSFEESGPRDRDADRRFAVRFTLWVVSATAILIIAAPLFWALRDAKAVSQGRGVSTPLTVGWQATPATITWLGESNAVVAKAAATHCLMYLGEANGVTVLFDVDDQVTLRLPTAQLVVLAVPLDSPDFSAIRSRCVH